MLTREELFELFENQYSQEQVLGAIAQLAVKDNSINPDASEFPSSIVDQLKAILKPPKKVKNQLAPVKEPEQLTEAEEEETIGREDLFGYFEKYDPEQIKQALLKLGQDPKAHTFPVEVVYRLDEAFTLIETALEQQKQAGLTGDLVQLQNLALEMASGKLDMPNHVFAELIEVIASRAVIQGTVLGKITNAISDRVYQQVTGEHFVELIERAGVDISLLYENLREPGNIERLLEDNGFKTAKQSQVDVILNTVSETEEFDPEAFLEETEPKKFTSSTTTNGKNQPRPKTSQDIKNLAKVVLKQSLSL